MARTYSETRTYQLPDEEAMHRAESASRRVLTEVFSTADATLRLYVSMSADGGFESTGDAWDDVLSELTSDGLVPTRTYVAFYPGRSLADPSTVVSDRGQTRVTVHIKSDDEGIVRATAAKLDRLVGPLVSAPPNEEARHSLPAAKPPAPAAALARGVGESDSWLARSWRDHAAGLVITVLGTVVAAIILAGVFKIGT